MFISIKKGIHIQKHHLQRIRIPISPLLQYLLSLPVITIYSPIQPKSSLTFPSNTTLTISSVVQQAQQSSTQPFSLSLDHHSHLPTTSTPTQQPSTHPTCSPPHNRTPNSIHPLYNASNIVNCIPESLLLASVSYPAFSDTIVDVSPY
ncbi:hypothetical protein S245_051092 [Arachis hypogaea]